MPRPATPRFEPPNRAVLGAPSSGHKGSLRNGHAPHRSRPARRPGLAAPDGRGRFRLSVAPPCRSQRRRPRRARRHQRLYERITTMKGNFIQVEPSGNVDEGRFYISKPGRMRFEYAAPVPTLLVADGSTVAVANTRLKTIDRYPIFETPLDVILSKSIDIRHNPALVSVEHRAGAFVVNLRANQAH